MNIRDMNVMQFLEDLRSSSPAPGGGAAAALTGAQGAALIMMVTELTIGKEKYKEHESVCKSTRANLSPIYINFILMADQDREAYSKVSEAQKMPKDTDEEKEARKVALAEAVRLATKVSLNIMDLSHGALKELSEVVGNSNPNVASDLGIAYYNLNAALYGAWLNLKVNLQSMEDQKLKGLFEENAQIFIDKSSVLSEAIKEKLALA